MKTLLTLILMGLLVFGFFWYLGVARQDERVLHAEGELVHSVGKMKEAIQDKLRDHSLDSEAIKEELGRTGKVVRQLAREVGTAVAEATADARTTATIKAKFVTDSDLSALSISVNTTNGVVTLSGTVSSYELIGKAMLLALETEGVREVVSTLQVRQVRAD